MKMLDNMRHFIADIPASTTDEIRETIISLKKREGCNIQTFHKIVHMDSKPSKSLLKTAIKESDLVMKHSWFLMNTDEGRTQLKHLKYAVMYIRTMMHFYDKIPHKISFMKFPSWFDNYCKSGKNQIFTPEINDNDEFEI